MAIRNLEQNENYFEGLVNGLGAESRIIFKNQLQVGDTIKFTYKSYAYTGIVTSTPRALFGHYTAKNTKNRLVTMFIFSSPSVALPLEKVVSFVSEVYEEDRLMKTKKARYIPQRHITAKLRWDRFWSSIKRLFNIDTPTPTLSSRNFRTFILNYISNCQKIRPSG